MLNQSRVITNALSGVCYRLLMSINNFAKTPSFRFWQKSGGRMAEKHNKTLYIKPK